MSALRPLGDRLIVEPRSEERADSRVIIPDVAQEKPQRGKVRAVGPDVENLGGGEVVLYSKYGGTEVEHEGQKLVVLKQADVLAVVE